MVSYHSEVAYDLPECPDDAPGEGDMPESLPAVRPMSRRAVTRELVALFQGTEGFRLVPNARPLDRRYGEGR